ncbi:MAG TPA: RNA 2',3'-cyclic phosphodiesterase [Fimbriimonadaceae bacterium]|nr:RNA 2',3'-cyclic phosphodiesterase [Fimbriimonadaceae bacterium]HRJ96660.1 RNA 2',3'-cyclic phosphodiesterase [Fimbriimonadaceae bacterium]
MRLFAAIELPAHVRKAVLDLQSGLRSGVAGVRWVQPENLHLTLVFFGEVSDPERLSRCIGAAAYTGLDSLILEDVRGYPERRPRVIVIDVADDGGVLARLVAEVKRRTVDWPSDERPFRAHVTLGRVKNPGAVGHDDLRSSRPAGIEWKPEEFVLFESRLTNSGSVYRPIERYPLI